MEFTPLLAGYRALLVVYRALYCTRPLWLEVLFTLGLFWWNSDLFWQGIGLFWPDIGLFCYMRPSWLEGRFTLGLFPPKNAEIASRKRPISCQKSPVSCQKSPISCHKRPKFITAQECRNRTVAEHTCSQMWMFVAQMPNEYNNKRPSGTIF